MEIEIPAAAAGASVHFADRNVTTTVGSMDLDRVSHSEPIRLIRSHRGQRHYSGLYWSFRTQTHVAYESRLELDRLLLADFDSATRWLAAQPFQLRGSDADGMIRHVPDFCFQRHDAGLLPEAVTGSNAFPVSVGRAKPPMDP